MTARHLAADAPELIPGEGAWLTQDVETKWGRYAAGVPVEVLEIRGDGHVVVCLDNGAHARNGGQCHAGVLPREALR